MRKYVKWKSNLDHDKNMVERGVHGTNLMESGLDENDMCQEVKQYWCFGGNLLVGNNLCAKKSILLLFFLSLFLFGIVGWYYI